MARGRLRIYLGAAPGVGKTFAMLSEGHRRAERGTDVVVGFVETYGRQRTAAQVDGLEVIPVRTHEYGGSRAEEMDVDAILERRPAVALVDELAHTNRPGARHGKRWEDVELLLDAGIDVITTVNIQHLESLNDVVTSITGVIETETVPDALVRSADQVELVDMTPEAIRRRMAHGNIYQAAMIDVALGAYFREGNLTALRELALLWVADRVDTELLDYRVNHGIDRPWETRERVAVALTGAPGGDDLVRRAARVAARSKAELVGIHVRTGDERGDPAEPALEAHKQLLTGLGGGFRDVVDPNVAKALVTTAIAENATQLVLGASRRSWWTRITHGSVINSVIAEAGGAIDVHVIAASSDAAPVSMPPSTRRLRISRLSRKRQLAGLLVAAVGLPLLTVALAPFADRFGFTSVALCFLLAVVAIGAIGGAWVAVLAAVGGFLLLNWFFAAPVHTFTISSERDAIAVTAFLVVAAVVSTLVERAARRSADARRARAEAQGLASMAGALLREDDPLPDLMASIVAIFAVDGASLVERQGDEPWIVIAKAGGAPPATPDDAELSVPLAAGVHLALAGPPLGADARGVVNAFATQLAVALESRRLRSEAATAAALSKANDLRNALLAAVSHDLRTPLAAIKASTSTLLDHEVPLAPDAVNELLETVDAETDRLNDLVGNLLDLGRIEAGAVSFTSEPTSIESIVEEAIAISAPQASVAVELPDTLPLVTVDAGILERAVGNLLDNACRYTRSGSTVTLRGGSVGTRVELRIIDHGPGIPEADRGRVFAPFERLERGPESAGVGLGLAVARGFIEALDGTLVIEDTPGGGTTMVISLPVDPPVGDDDAGPSRPDDGRRSLHDETGPASPTVTGDGQPAVPTPRADEPVRPAEVDRTAPA